MISLRSTILRRVARLGIGLTVLALVAGVRTAWSHPIHTTLTDIALDPADGSMHFTIRALGKPAPFVWGGSKRAGDVIWVTFKVPSVRALRGVKIASTLLLRRAGLRIRDPGQGVLLIAH